MSYNIQFCTNYFSCTYIFRLIASFDVLIFISQNHLNFVPLHNRTVMYLTGLAFYFFNIHPQIYPLLFSFQQSIAYHHFSSFSPWTFNNGFLNFMICYFLITKFYHLCYYYYYFINCHLLKLIYLLFLIINNLLLIYYIF